MSKDNKTNGNFDWAVKDYADDGSEQEWDEETQMNWEEKMSMPLGIEIVSTAK